MRFRQIIEEIEATAAKAAEKARRERERLAKKAQRVRDALARKTAAARRYQDSIRAADDTIRAAKMAMSSTDGR